jgi:hypothetical protein
MLHDDRGIGCYVSSGFDSMTTLDWTGLTSQSGGHVVIAALPRKTDLPHRLFVVRAVGPQRAADPSLIHLITSPSDSTG